VADVQSCRGDSERVFGGKGNMVALILGRLRRLTFAREKVVVEVIGGTIPSNGSLGGQMGVRDCLYSFFPWGVFPLSVYVERG